MRPDTEVASDQQVVVDAQVVRDQVVLKEARDRLFGARLVHPRHALALLQVLVVLLLLVLVVLLLLLVMSAMERLLDPPHQVRRGGRAERTDAELVVGLEDEGRIQTHMVVQCHASTAVVLDRLVEGA